MVWYERSSPNHPRWNESIHISDSVKTSTTTTEDRKQNKRNGSRSSSSHGKYSPEADQERKQQEQLEYKISLLDAMTRDLQKQVLEYRQKITHHEELESLQQQQINELTAHNTKSKVKYDELNQQYRHLEHTNSNEMDRLKEALEEARNNGLHWKEALDNSEKDNLNLKETLNKSETENLNLKESLDKSEKDSLLLKDALATRTKEWTTTQSDLTNYKEDLLRIKSERDQQIEEVKKLRQKVEDFDRLIPEGMTADQIHEEIEKVDRLEKEKESYEALVNETTNQLALLSKKNKELQQRLVEEDPTTSHGLFSFWHQRKTNKLDKKLLEAMCEQLEVQATVVDRLRTEVLSGDRLINHTMEKSNHRGWYWMLIFGICLVILSSCIGYAIVTPPISYGLWNDPHGCHSWQSCYTEPRSWLFLILDRILLPTNFTYVTPL
ncbi:uncharacterized protein BX664DRAFT_321011 [Halteromyces radiatus]|uniref:uncharacterized protein n=1 Tax=Halteromyces radiatus TaxID=101107 RepID=UPI00221F9AE5|nr:uncharacterized protein BX664DRAFT_321011 [Halteromyces radiatus]KAI8099315.1 hypothetical protein BX664DRAFT_321011 [Halteromyces radiatus]